MTDRHGYGAPPKDLGLIDLSPTEMMFWMYCPIFVPGATRIIIPPNLAQFEPIVEAALDDLEEQGIYYYDDDLYVYLTAKTLWVSGDYVGNRPGWHCDGFGTDDINYIWSDRAPTEFLTTGLTGDLSLSDDCGVSMTQMHGYGLRPAMYGAEITTYPDKHLLRLLPNVIHRSPVDFEAGMRTFVKVSVSKDRYDLVGNSINHGLPHSQWPLVSRKGERNHPQSRLA